MFCNPQFSMYFAYFHRFAPQKPSEIDNYWMVTNCFGNYRSKCRYEKHAAHAESCQQLCKFPPQNHHTGCFQQERPILCIMW